MTWAVVKVIKRTNICLVRWVSLARCDSTSPMNQYDLPFTFVPCMYLNKALSLALDQRPSFNVPSTGGNVKVIRPWDRAGLICHIFEINATP